MPILEKRKVVGPFQSNCWILVCTNTLEGVVIDPGDDALEILQVIQSMTPHLQGNIQIRYLLHTHAHLDHFGATRLLYQKLIESGNAQDADLKVALHEKDENLWNNLKSQAQMFGLQYGDPMPLSLRLQGGEELEFGDGRLKVVPTPGHSPGGVCFHLQKDSKNKIPEILYSGDTLFQLSIGRTDLWGGDMQQLLSSIAERIYCLGDEVRVCPGHGEDTKIGIEKLENPFVNQS